MTSPYYNFPEPPRSQENPHHFRPPTMPLSPAPPPPPRPRVALDILADAASSASASASASATSPTSSPTFNPSQQPPSPRHPPISAPQPQLQASQGSTASSLLPFPQSSPRLPPPFPSSLHPPPHVHSDLAAPHPHSAPPAMKSPFEHSFSPSAHSTHVQYHNRFPPRSATAVPSFSGQNMANNNDNTNGMQHRSFNPTPPPISTASQFRPTWSHALPPTTSRLRPRSFSCGADLDKHATGAIPYPPQTPPTDFNSWRLPPPAYPSSAAATPPSAFTPTSTSPSRRRPAGMYQYIGPRFSASSSGMPTIAATAAQPPLTKSGRRNSYLRFTPEEESMLEDGVRVLGQGNWKRILHAYSFHPKRSPVDLKDKWRNLSRSKAKKAAAKLSSVASQPDLNILSSSEISEASGSLRPSSLGRYAGPGPLSQSPRGATPSMPGSMDIVMNKSEFRGEGGNTLRKDGTDHDHPMPSCELRSM